MSSRTQGNRCGRVNHGAKVNFHAITESRQYDRELLSRWSVVGVNK